MNNNLLLAYIQVNTLKPIKIQNGPLFNLKFSFVQVVQLLKETLDQERLIMADEFDGHAYTTLPEATISMFPLDPGSTKAWS